MTRRPAALLIAILLASSTLSCGGGSAWLCEPTWDLWPGHARLENWPIAHGEGKPIQTHSKWGIRVELYPNYNPIVAEKNGYRTRRIAGWNPVNGRIFTGWLNHGPPEAIAASRALSEQFRKNPVLPPDQVARLNRLHKTTGIGVHEAAAMLREQPGADIPEDHDIHAWWKSHQTCKRTNWLRFWPEAILRSFGAACAAMG